MRKILDALFTAPRQAILAATLMEPERWWYLSDLARHLGVHHATLQRELARLTEAEILERRREGNRVYYRANLGTPVFPELKGLFAKTAGLVGILREALLPFAQRIRIAFVFGSVAKGTEASESDIDLMIVGDIEVADLIQNIRKAEDRIGRPVNVTVFRKAEFLNRLGRGSHFLASVLDNKKLFVVGSNDDLERLTRERPSRAPYAPASRNRRSAKGRAPGPRGRST